MATTPLITALTPPIALVPPLETTPMPDPGPLWRFALIGLGPLTALGIFALLVGLFQQHPA